jgi:hypothetical protein
MGFTAPILEMCTRSITIMFRRSKTAASLKADKFTVICELTV